MTIGSSNDHIDEFSIDSIPVDTFNMLTRFPEFRRLVKAYKAEQRKCRQWEKDYACLNKNYQELKENSFRMFFFVLFSTVGVILARPPAAAINYLVDLVDSIQQSSGRNDPRTDEQLARDLGEDYLFLLSLRESDPQQTALNLFNHFFPTYEEKLRIGAIQNLDVERPGFLRTLLSMYFKIEFSLENNYVIRSFFI
jgi:hypothetical protein